MNIRIFENPGEAGKAAGQTAARLIKKTIETKGNANIILATGTSQFETLRELILDDGIDWRRVVAFHLDEYINLPPTHPASFRRYLTERFLSKLPSLKAVYLINGEADANAECEKLGEMISRYPVDVAFVGIGENGHLAFNDPPADFETDRPYIIVELDRQCRQQQVNEGWFQSIDAVPRTAISMSVRQILKSKAIICSVPEARKADAVRRTIEGPVTNLCPASILQTHPACNFFLDRLSSAGLGAAIRESAGTTDN